MQFLNVVAVMGLAAFAVAAPQDAATSAAASASAVSASVSNEITSTAPAGPQNSCVLACGNDICCKAACVGVPCPNEGGVDKTTECAAKCVQGDGTEAETAKYAACQQACIQQNFFSSSGASGAGATGASGDDSASATSESGSSATGSDSGSSSESESASSTASGSASAASETGAASSLQLGSSAVGIVGLIVAALAL